MVHRGSTTLEPGELEQLLRGLRRSSLARSELTREYLNAGADLIRRGLNHDPRSEDPHPFLKFISQGEIRRAVNRRGNLTATDGSLRDRWAKHSDYVADLLAWMGRTRRQPAFAGRETALIDMRITSSAQPSAIVRDLVERNLTALFSNALFRLHLLLAAAFRTSRPESAGLYADIDPAWAVVVDRFMRGRRLTLRPGVEPEDLVAALVAVGDGLALRELTEPTEGAARERRIGQQAIVVLALLSACIDDGSGRTLDEAVDALLRER